MARLHFAALLLAAALVVTSGARLPLQAAAPAPSPGAAQNGADVLFIMEADQGSFTDAQTLTLSGLTGSAQSFAVGGKTAVYPIAAFVGNRFVDTTGAWLGNPQAVFYGVNAQGNTTSAVLALSSPKINTPAPGTNNNNNNNNNNGGTITNNNNNNGQTLSFTVAAVPADASKVKMPGGAVSQKVSEAASGANNGFVSAITPGTQFSNIVLFIDTNQQSVNNVAATKWGWGGFFPDYYQGYNNGWGSYNNNNNNNNNNNGGWGAVNNNNNNNNNNGGFGANNNNNNNNNNNGGFGAVNNNNNNNNNGFGGANNNNNNNNNGRH